MSRNTSGDAFSMDVVGVRPCRVDVDIITADLNVLGDPRQQYAAVLGSVASTVLNLVRSHQDCTATRCPTCWELRYATAALAALPFDHYTFRLLREGIR